jgi:SPP1 family predicted phage head-tail adaptor
MRGAGEFNRRVTVRTIERTEAAGGGWTETPRDVHNVPAKVEQLEGREQVSAMQVGMERPHRFTTRYFRVLTGASRVIYAGRTFDVRSVVDPEERHRELEILADEIRDASDG